MLYELVSRCYTNYTNQLLGETLFWTPIFAGLHTDATLEHFHLGKYFNLPVKAG